MNVFDEDYAVPEGFVFGDGYHYIYEEGDFFCRFAPFDIVLHVPKDENGKGHLALYGEKIYPIIIHFRRLPENKIEYFQLPAPAVFDVVLELLGFSSANSTSSLHERFVAYSRI